MFVPQCGSKLEALTSSFTSEICIVLQRNCFVLLTVLRRTLRLNVAVLFVMEKNLEHFVSCKQSYLPRNIRRCDLTLRHKQDKRAASGQRAGRIDMVGVMVAI